MKLRPVEYEYLHRPFWSEGRYMMTRVLHELTLKCTVSITNRKKIVHAKDPHPRIRPFISLGHSKNQSPELYDQFFLDLLNEYGPMWMTDLVIRAHHKLRRDSDRFKKDYVEPVLRRKKYLKSTSFLTGDGRKSVRQISNLLTDLEEHAKGKINAKFVAPRLEALEFNFILLNEVTRKKLGKELPAIQFEFTSAFSSANSITFSTMEFASFDSSFDGGFGDSSFDGFGGGDFGGGGGGDNW